MEFRRKNIYIAILILFYAICVVLFGVNFEAIKEKIVQYFSFNSNIFFFLIISFITFIYTLIIKFIIENNKIFKIEKLVGKYLSADIVKKLIKNNDKIELGGQKKSMTVLFADIRNFTNLSENLSASSVCEILNEYFGAMVPIIEENNGVLNKYIGDALLAIFKDEDCENSSLCAVSCALKMIKALKALQEKWDEKNKPKINIGIGISSGEVFIGNIGTKNHLEYTVLGDTVNLASRIENYNKVYKTNLLISETTYEKIKDKVDVITIKNVSVKGKTNKINLYEVIRII